MIETGSNNGVIFGEAQHPPLKEIKSKVIVNFRPHNNWTRQFGLIGLHGMGLHHTFGNDSNFTFKQSETENIMDYVDTRRVIWKWQWNIIRSNTLIKPE